MRRTRDENGKRLCDYGPCNRKGIRAEVFSRFGAHCQECSDMREDEYERGSADDFARHYAGTDMPLD